MTTCPGCGSEETRIKSYRRLTVSRWCKHCKKSFTTPKEPVPVEENEENTTQAEEVTYESSVPQSPEQAIRKFKIDQEKWSVESCRLEERERVIAGGAVRPVYKTTLSLKSLKPQQDIPVINPVYIYSRKNKIPKNKPEALNRSAVILSDAHMGYRRDFKSGRLLPFHDRETLDLALLFCMKEEPDEIILNGDWLDLTEFTDKFLRSPDVFFTLQPSLVELSWFIGQLREACPSSRIVYLEGNHEKRLSIIMQTHMAAAYGVFSMGETNPSLSVPALLGLESMAVEYFSGYPREAVFWLNENIFVHHGYLSKATPGATAAAYLKNARASSVFAHIHRAERAGLTVEHYDGDRTYYSQCFGMMGNPERTPPDDVFHGWQRGFGVVHYQPYDGGFAMDAIDIYKGRETIYGKDVLVGTDYTDRLIQDTDWKAFGI